MPGVVVKNAVVDFVGENDQVVLAGAPRSGLQRLFAVYGASGVVGVDHHDAAGIGRNPGLHVLEVGLPVIGLVAAIMHRLCRR